MPETLTETSAAPRGFGRDFWVLNTIEMYHPVTNTGRMVKAEVRGLAV